MSPDQPTRIELLDRVGRLRRERDDALYRLNQLEYAAVLDARLDGATWAQVGQALGVSTQAARKKFSGRMLPALEPEGISDSELEVLIEAELAEHRAAPGRHLRLLK